MALNKLNFTRNWNSQADFPTIEPDEAKVRADLQALHDEAKDAINANVDALKSTTTDSGASQIGIASVIGLIAATVQQAIEAIVGRVITLERFNSLFNGITEVKTVLAASDATIPTSKAVADAISEAGGGDMMRASYDSTNTGTKVDTALNAEKLGGQLPAWYQQALVYDDKPTEGSDNAMTSGGIYNALKWYGKQLVLYSGELINSYKISQGADTYSGFGSVLRNDIGATLSSDNSSITLPTGVSKVRLRLDGLYRVDLQSSPFESSNYIELNGSSTGVNYTSGWDMPLVSISNLYSFPIVKDVVITVPNGTNTLRVFFNPGSSGDAVQIYQLVVEVVE